jgi:hypothetical protein
MSQTLLAKTERYTPSLWPAVNQEQVLLATLAARLGGQALPPSLIRFGLRFKGDFKDEALQFALNEIVVRHAGLRTVFLENPEIPRQERARRLAAFSRTGICLRGVYTQLLLLSADVPIQSIDFSGYSHDERRAAIRSWIRDEDARPFDRQGAPLLRAGILKLGARERLVVLFMDHIVTDAWSAMLLRREVQQLYLEFHEFGTINKHFTPPRISFPQFAAWQNRALSTTYFGDDLRYWRDQWARFGAFRLAPEDLAPASSLTKEPNFVFLSDYEHFRNVEANAIRSFARRCHVTLYMLFLEAFAILLTRLSGKSAVAIWSHLSNRTHSDTSDVVGYFANSHILGIDMSGNPTGQELLSRIRDVVTEAVAHQELPLWHMWRVLNCIPRFARPAILMDYLSIPKLPKSTSNVADAVEIQDVLLPDSLLPRLALAGIYIRDDGEHIAMKIKYDTSRFSTDAMRQFLIDLANTLRMVIQSPSSRVSELTGVTLTQVHKSVDENRMNHFLLLDSKLIPAVPDVNMEVSPQLR